MTAGAAKGGSDLVAEDSFSGQLFGGGGGTTPGTGGGGGGGGTTTTNGGGGGTTAATAGVRLGRLNTRGVREEGPRSLSCSHAGPRLPWERSAALRGSL